VPQKNDSIDLKACGHRDVLYPHEGRRHVQVRITGRSENPGLEFGTPEVKQRPLRVRLNRVSKLRNLKDEVPARPYYTGDLNKECRLVLDVLDEGYRQDHIDTFGQDRKTLRHCLDPRDTQFGEVDERLAIFVQTN